MADDNDFKCEYSQQVTEVGVDWITATGKGEASYKRVFPYVAEYSDYASKAAEKMTKFTVNGFKMSQIGQLAWGRRGTEWMVRAWGDCSLRLWRPFSAYSENVPRIDLQVTVAYSDYTGDEVKEYYRQLLDSSQGKATKSKVLIQNHLKGDSLYIGSRESSQMGRLYDKYRQSKSSDRFCNCLRFEVEYKKPLSQAVVTWLLSEDPTAEGIGNKVFSWFFERGIITPQIPSGGESAMQIPLNPTTPERRLNWLKTQVRQVYQQLKMAGFEEEANEALGLPNAAIEPTKVILHKEN